MNAWKRKVVDLGVYYLSELLTGQGMVLGIIVSEEQVRGRDKNLASRLETHFESGEVGCLHATGVFFTSSAGMESKRKGP